MGISSRPRQFAFESHQKALAAQQSGAFDDELISVEAPKGRKGTVVLSRDEGPRADTSLEKLTRLRPAFIKDGSGTVTAGNSSTLNDGASAMIVCSEAAAKRYGLQPLAAVRSCAAAGVNPRTMGLGPVPATQKPSNGLDLGG